MGPMRQEISVRAGAGAEADDVDRGSCCTLVGLRWRAKQKSDIGFINSPRIICWS